MVKPFPVFHAIADRPFLSQESTAASYRNKFKITVLGHHTLDWRVLRAGKVCTDDPKRTIDAGLDLLGSPELKKMSQAYPETTEQWMQEGADNLNKGVMADGIDAVCAHADKVRSRAEEILKSDR